MLKIGDIVINVEPTSIGYKKIYTIVGDNALTSFDDTYMVIDENGIYCSFDKYKLKIYNEMTKLLYF